MNGKNYKILSKKAGQAINRYNMISEGDRILTAVSGGKDSLTLLRILSGRQEYSPAAYELFAAYIDPGFGSGFSRELEQYCKKFGVNIITEYTDYGILAHSKKNRENPCFLCSKLRKKRLFEIADSLGCNKVALGHNKDDIIETLFLNIFYSGEISAMVPCQAFFKGKFTIIRPLAFADEDIIRTFVKEQNLPFFENKCPSAKNSKRQEIKSILNNLYKTNKKIKGNVFRALSHVKIDYLLTEL